MPYGYDFNVTPVQVENGTDYSARKDAASARKIELQQRQIQLDEAKKAQKFKDVQEATAGAAYGPKTTNMGNMQLPGGGYIPMGSVQGPAQLDRGAYTQGLQKAGYGYEAMQADQQFQTQDLQHQQQMAQLSEALGKANGEQLKNLGTALDLQGRYISAVDQAPPQLKPQIYAQARAAALQAGVPGADQLPPQYDPATFDSLKSKFMDVKEAADLANKNAVLQQQKSVADETARHNLASERNTRRGQDMSKNTADENRKASLERKQTLAPKDMQAVQTKLTSIGLARQQLQNVKEKFEKLKGSLSAGPGGSLLPTQGGQSFDKAVDAMRQTITSLTRTPGVGSMSDYETRLFQAQLPERGNYEDVTGQQIQQVSDMLDTLEQGYQGMKSDSGGKETADPLGLR